MTDVCIVAASRTPFGRFLGALSEQSAVDLAVQAGNSALRTIPRSCITQVILGNVLGAGLGMNISRQVGIRLQLPVSTPAWTVNMMCGSGMQSIRLAAQAIQADPAQVILCGGTESMSNAPHLLRRARQGLKYGHGELVDSVLSDGLLDAFSGDHMALTAERLAARYSITRNQQDEFAARSQQRYSQAVAAGRFKAELALLNELNGDEQPRPDTSLDRLARLKPAFSPSGTITAGNASGLNDGAAILVLASRATAAAQGWPALATVHATAAVGCDPAEMGLGPVFAIRQLCQSRRLDLEDVETIEINEAFAAQTLACMQELGLSGDRVNPCGGAIAIGHPIGTSGARLVAHVAHQIHSGAYRSALAALCVGGGMGIAMFVQQVPQ